MRILYITHTTYSGGATIALYNIVKSMVEKGHIVFVVSNNGNGPLDDYMVNAGATLLYAPVSETVYERYRGIIRTIWRFANKAYGWWISRKLINKYICEYSIDIVHTNVGPLNLALSACKKHSIPHVWHHREYFDKCDGVPFFPYNRYFYKLITTKGNFNICITNQIKEYLNLTSNVKVIYDGVFPAAYLNKTINKEKDDYILFVGRFEENKGQDTLLSVWSKFVEKYPNYKLLMVGEFSKQSPFFEKCIEIVKNKGIENSVEFLGNRKDVYDLMKRAKALVVTSFYEGFGFITVEGMLNNTVVIGRDMTGTHEQFNNGVLWTGGEIGLRFNNELQLLDCLYTSVSQDMTEIINRARKAIEKYTIENNADQLENIYRQLIKMV